MTDTIDFKRTFQFILMGNPRLSGLIEKAAKRIPELGEVFYRGRFSWRHYIPNIPFAINLHRAQTCTNAESLIDAINTDIHYTARNLEKSFFDIMHEHGEDIAKSHFSNCEIEDLRFSDLPQHIGPKTVREDYLWPTDKNPATEFFEGKYGLPSTLEQQFDQQTKATMEEFFQNYDALCGALEKGQLFAMGRRLERVAVDWIRDSHLF